MKKTVLVRDQDQGASMLKVKQLRVNVCGNLENTKKKVL